MNFSTLISFQILLLFLSIFYIAANPLLAIETLEDQIDGDDDICKKIECGEGKCVPTNTSFLGIGGFDCVCNPGWQKPQLAFISLPACTVPNCTINFQCGSSAVSPPPPPLINLPLIGLTPCTFVWCGEGSCVVNGTGYYCKCNEGAENLFNLTKVACFKDCYLGADCDGVGLGHPVSPPSPSGNASGPHPNSPPQLVNGTKSNEPNCSSGFGRVTTLLFLLVMLLVSV